LTEKNNVQFYKQGPGAVDDVGGSIEPGWYYVAMRDTAAGGPAPYGPSTGPFKTKRDAERAYKAPGA
jgi:hypothetical protein